MRVKRPYINAALNSLYRGPYSNGAFKYGVFWGSERHYARYLRGFRCPDRLSRCWAYMPGVLKKGLTRTCLDSNFFYQNMPLGGPYYADNT